MTNANISLYFRDTLGLKSYRMTLAETENGCSVGEQGDSDVTLKASVLGGFGHIEETKTLISNLPEVHGEMLSRELTIERFGGKEFPSIISFLNPYA